MFPKLLGAQPRRRQTRFNLRARLQMTIRCQKSACGTSATNLASCAISVWAQQLQGPDISPRFGASIALTESWNVSAVRVASCGPIPGAAAEGIP
jgi:hypothetical protein